MVHKDYEGEELLLIPRLLEPLGETKSDFQICAELADRFGVRDAFTEGLDERGWVNRILEQYRENLEIPCRRFLPNSLDVSINNKTVNILLEFCCMDDFFLIFTGLY